MQIPEELLDSIKNLDKKSLREAFKNFNCRNMARAWRNRSRATRNLFYGAVTTLVGVEPYPFEVHTRLAASLYVACGHVSACQAVLSTARWPKAYWPWLISNWYRYATNPVDKQLLRGEYIIGHVIKQLDK